MAKSGRNAASAKIKSNNWSIPLAMPSQPPGSVYSESNHSEIGLFHSEICVRSSHDTRFGGTKHDSCRLVTTIYQLGMEI